MKCLSCGSTKVKSEYGNDDHGSCGMVYHCQDCKLYWDEDDVKDSRSKMKVLNLEIDKCDDCPYWRKNCEHPALKVYSIDFVNDFISVPDWCPLPDNDSSEDEEQNKIKIKRSKI